MAWDFGKRVAWYVNTTLVKTKLSKCSFVWDGGTQGKYNMGCGCHSSHIGCDDIKSPYYNLDPATNYTQQYTGKSQAVAGCLCETKPEKRPTSWGHGPDCYWRGVAFDHENCNASFTAGNDDTWQMLKWRVDHQDYSPMDQKKDPRAFWNEMIIDGDMLLRELEKDAAATIPAFIYQKGVAGAKGIAQSMANEMQKQYKLSKAVPIISCDNRMDITHGGNPFSVEEEEEETMI